MLPPLGFPAVRHMQGRRTRDSRSFRPRGVPRPGFRTPLAASTTIPPGALRHRSVHRLPPARRSPRADRDSSRSPLPSWRCSRRFASPPWGACGRGRLQGFVPGANSCWPPRPEGRGASMPSWGSPFRAFPPGCLEPHVGLQGLPSHASTALRWGRTASQGLAAARVGWPLSGLPALLGFLTSRPSRRRSDRTAGRAHGFASRLAPSWRREPI